MSGVISTALQGFYYLPTTVYLDLLNQIANPLATRIAIVCYISAAVAFYIPLAISSPPTLSYVQTYIVAFVLLVFAPMILGGIRVAFSNNAEGLQQDVACPIIRPSFRKHHHIMSILGYIQECLELFSAGIKCAIESGYPLLFIDGNFQLTFAFFAGGTRNSYVFRAVFWICTLFLWIIRKYFGTLTTTVGVRNRYIVWWSPTISYDCPFYILICEVMIGVFGCVSTSDPAVQVLGDLDPPITCWKGEHLVYTIIAFLSMIAYFPSGCSMCSCKDLITFDDSDLKFVPAYIKFSQMIKGVSICSMVLFAKNPAVAFSISSTCMLILLITTLKFWPSSTLGLNSLKIFTYTASMFLYIFIATEVYQSYLNVVQFGLAVGLGMVVIIAASIGYESFITFKRTKNVDKQIADILLLFPAANDRQGPSTKRPKSSREFEPLDIEHQKMRTVISKRPVEMYTSFLLSDKKLYYIPAFLSLPNAENKIYALDNERQYLIWVALNQMRKYGRKHPAYEEALLKVDDIKMLNAIQAMNRIIYFLNNQLDQKDNDQDLPIVS